MNKSICCIVAAIALGAGAGVLDNIADAIQQAKDAHAEKQQHKESSVSDAELLRMVREQYEVDMASGNYAKWHGKMARQIVIDTPAETNLAKMVKIFADGFCVTNNFRKPTPRTDAERKILAAKRAEAAKRAQLEKLKKQIEEMKAGVPLAALEAKAKNLEAALGKSTTNLVITIGAGAK